MYVCTYYCIISCANVPFTSIISLISKPNCGDAVGPWCRVQWHNLNLRRSTPRRCRRKSMVLLAVIEWAGCRTDQKFVEQNIRRDVKTSFDDFLTSISHHVHRSLADSLCHVPRFEVSGKFLELAPSMCLGFRHTNLHSVSGEDFK